jgi:putative FmdB family regulatory protein
MPIYEYQCPQGHITERVRPIDETVRPQMCAHEGCGHPAIRILSVANVNVDAVIKPGDISYTPRMTDYLGHRRWRRKQDEKLEAERKAKNPVTSYKGGPGHS